jgi:hypothetical protein
VVGTRRKLAWVGPYMPRREVNFVNLIVALGRNSDVENPISHALFASRV